MNTQNNINKIMYDSLLSTNPRLVEAIFYLVKLGQTPDEIERRAAASGTPLIRSAVRCAAEYILAKQKPSQCVNTD